MMIGGREAKGKQSGACTGRALGAQRFCTAGRRLLLRTALVRGSSLLEFCCLTLRSPCTPVHHLRILQAIICSPTRLRAELYCRLAVGFKVGESTGALQLEEVRLLAGFQVSGQLTRSFASSMDLRCRKSRGSAAPSLSPPPIPHCKLVANPTADGRPAEFRWPGSVQLKGDGFMRLGFMFGDVVLRLRIDSWFATMVAGLSAQRVDCPPEGQSMQRSGKYRSCANPKMQKACISPLPRGDLGSVRCADVQAECTKLSKASRDLGNNSNLEPRCQECSAFFLSPAANPSSCLNSHMLSFLRSAGDGPAGWRP